MCKPMLRVEQARAVHFNGEESGLLEFVCWVQHSQSLFEALAPRGKLMFLIDIAPKLQETPKDVGEQIIL